MKTVICITLLLLAAMAACADSPKVALEAKDMSLADAVADLAKQAGVQIICDAGAKATINGRFESIELDKLLDSITKTNSLKWQKVYLPAKADEKPTVEQVKARAEAVSAVTSGTMIVFDPATGKQKVFVEQDAATPTVAPDKLGLTLVYVISKPSEVKTDTAATGDAAKKYQALETQRMQLLARMTPEQRISAVQQEMVSLINMDPAARQQIMIAQMQARQNMDPQLQDQYRQAMRDTFQAMRDQGLITGDRGPGGGFGGDRGSRRNRDGGNSGQQ